MEQGTQEWKEFRKTKIGGSDAPVIMGVSPWKTPFQLWEEKILGKEQEITSSMSRGMALEESARQRFQEKVGVLMMPKVVVHPERDWQIASLDGISFDGKEILEIKHANKDVFYEATQGNLPDYYMMQIQHMLHVTGAERCYYFVSTGTEDTYVSVLPNEKMINKIVKEEEKFFKFMIDKEPPPLTDRDYVIKDDQEWLNLVKEYKEAKDELHILKDCEQLLREKLIERSGGRNAVGGGIKLTKSICKGQVDYSLVPELMGVNLEPYRKPSCEKWRISDISNTET